LPDGAESTGTPGGLRRAREALLLDLGALVYELHRRGRRAPELLQEKASELGALDDRLDGETVGEPGPPACPACGAEAEPRQLVCTSCGARLTLGRSQSRNVAVLAVLAAVIAVGAGASGFALSEITSDDGDGAVPPAAQAPPQQAPAAAAGEPQEATQGSGTAPEAPTPEPPAEPRSLLLDWPADLTAHTVVLVSSSDRPAALRVARAAARSGIEAGMLRSDDYNLGTGLWIVFAGRFDTAEGASRQASDLAERYPGAYPQLVEPSG
jgi:hypothetical protein